MKHLPRVSRVADLGQWEPILSRSRRRGAMFGGSTELPGSWGLMMKGAGGGGGGGWDGGPVEGSASAKAKSKWLLCEIRNKYNKGKIKLP